MSSQWSKWFSGMIELLQASDTAASSDAEVARGYGGTSARKLPQTSAKRFQGLSKHGSANLRKLPANFRIMISSTYETYFRNFRNLLSGPNCHFQAHLLRVRIDHFGREIAADKPLVEVIFRGLFGDTEVAL